MAQRKGHALLRLTGVRLMLGSVVVGLVGVAPLLLYVAIGPADGNPVGLGLLAMLALALGAIGLLLGVVLSLVQLLLRRHQS
jgi:hypothetical protein